MNRWIYTTDGGSVCFTVGSWGTPGRRRAGNNANMPASSMGTMQRMSDRVALSIFRPAHRGTTRSSSRSTAGCGPSASTATTGRPYSNRGSRSATSRPSPTDLLPSAESRAPGGARTVDTISAPWPPAGQAASTLTRAIALEVGASSLIYWGRTIHAAYPTVHGSGELQSGRFAGSDRHQPSSRIYVTPKARTWRNS